MNQEEFRNIQWQQPDAEAEARRQDEYDTRRFWYFCVPLGALAGFFACVIGGSGAYFIPVWGITAFVLWAVGGEKE